MITFSKTPQKYTPVNNPIIFQVSSDNSLIQFFQVQVQADDNSVIANLRLYTTPANRTSSFTDLSSILSNVVNYQLLPSTNILESTPNVLQAYKLKVTEKLYSTSGIVDGSTSTSGLFYTWNGLIDKVSFTQYDYKNYVLNGTGNTTNFLTNKPQVSNIYRTSTEYLYFLNDSQPGNLNLKFYGVGNILLGNQNISLSGSTTGCTRVDISPTALGNYFGLSLGNTYGHQFQNMFTVPFGSAYSINAANYYTATLTNTSGVTKSITRTYILKDTGCANVPVQITFANQLGGIDGFTFFNPREQIDVVKTSLIKNPFKLSNGIYSDNANNVYNDETSVINVDSTSTYKVISAPLTDAESIYLKELMKSEKVYIQLRNGMFYPISVTNLSYPVTQKRYSTTLIRLELSFKINDTGVSF